MTCLACDVVSGVHHPVGGVLATTRHFVIHGVAQPSPVAGWLVLTSRVHCRAIYELDDEAAAELGVLSTRLAKLLRTDLGAEHVYLFAIGDLLHHCHVHVVPRFAGTPSHLRGRGVFDAKAEELRPAEELEAACAKLRAANEGWRITGSNDSTL